MKKLIASFGLMLALAGCVPSVNPLYTEKDLTFDAALVGIWGGDNEKETWTFEKAGEKKYKLLHTDEKGRTGEFDARLVKLDKHLFLDLYVIDAGEKEEWQINELARFAIIMRPGHLFAKVSQLKPTLKIGFLNPEWLEKLLEKEPAAIRHDKIHSGAEGNKDSQIVLTAETRELQKFVLKYADDENAFGEPSEMVRKQQQTAAGKNDKSK